MDLAEFGASGVPDRWDFQVKEATLQEGLRKGDNSFPYNRFFCQYNS
jgi:hypothetical protein